MIFHTKKIEKILDYYLGFDYCWAPGGGARLTAVVTVGATMRVSFAPHGLHSCSTSDPFFNWVRYMHTHPLIKPNENSNRHM